MNKTSKNSLDDWLTVHRSITLFDLQLDAQILIYLHIIHLLKSSTCFEHYTPHLQEVYVVTVYICSLWYRHSLQVTVLCAPVKKDGQGNARNMYRILINVLYVNK
jgi:hypothetical protein